MYTLDNLEKEVITQPNISMIDKVLELIRTDCADPLYKLKSYSVNIIEELEFNLATGHDIYNYLDSALVYTNGYRFILDKDSDISFSMSIYPVYSTVAEKDVAIHEYVIGNKCINDANETRILVFQIIQSLMADWGNEKYIDRHTFSIVHNIKSEIDSIIACVKFADVILDLKYSDDESVIPILKNYYFEDEYFHKIMEESTFNEICKDIYYYAIETSHDPNDYGNLIKNNISKILA